MVRGKCFNLYLMDGSVTGRIKCTLSNWTGLVYKIPRLLLSSCKDRYDLKQSGVYFLFGKNENDEDEVYIGQAGIRKNGEGILFRVSEHIKDETYFSDAVLLTTQNNSFGPTEISYLENRFTNIATSVGRYIVRNINDPSPGNVTEEKESELEDFIEYSEMALGVLGYNIFVPLTKNDSLDVKEDNIDELILSFSRKSMKSDKLIEAKCKRTTEGFVVLRESMIEIKDSENIPSKIKELRREAKEKGYIEDGILKKEYIFNSPSYAAAFIIGMNTNGRKDWKFNGKTLKDIEENEVD